MSKKKQNSAASILSRMYSDDDGQLDLFSDDSRARTCSPLRSNGDSENQESESQCKDSSPNPSSPFYVNKTLNPEGFLTLRRFPSLNCNFVGIFVDFHRRVRGFDPHMYPAYIGRIKQLWSNCGESEEVYRQVLDGWFKDEWTVKCRFDVSHLGSIDINKYLKSDSSGKFTIKTASAPSDYNWETAAADEAKRVEDLFK